MADPDRRDPALTPTQPATSSPDSPARHDEQPQLPVVPAEAYRIFGEHARGGIGRVLRAEDRRLRRAVAVKELIADSVNARHRFLREAELTARLQHPSIVPVYEAGEWPDGRPFYAMKFISGQSLKDLITAAASLEERLALVPHVIAVAEAIAYAHSRSIIHRDLKPMNVVVGEFGETMVVDWGLGKDLSRQAGDDAAPEVSPDGAHTVVGAVVGTPAFMPPEQAAGEVVDERADIYSIGAILYNMLSGRPPYDGEATDILARVASSDPPPIEQVQPGAPPDLAAIVAHAMARDRARRYASARELAADLKRFQTGQLVSARHYSPSVLLRRWLRRNVRLVAAAASFALVLATVGGVSVRRILSERRVARAERALAVARSQELTLVQARTSLDRDPTAAIAWLKTAHIDDRSWPDVAAIAADARARGVARAVLRAPGGGAMATPQFSGDGTRVYIEADTGGFFVTDPNAPRALAYVAAPETQQNDFLRTANGKHLVVAAMTGPLIDIDDAHGVRLLGPLGQPAPVETSPVGDRAVTCGRDGALRLWNLDRSTSQLLAILPGGCGSATWSPDGALLAATAARDGTIHVWDTATGAPRARPEGFGRHRSFSWSPSGHFVVTSDGSCAMRATNLATGAVTSVGPLQECLYGGYLPGDRRYQITAEGVLRVWPLGGGAPRLVRAHTAKIEEAAVSADGSRLITCSEDETARVWDTRSLVARTLRGHVQSVLGCELSPDARVAVTAGTDGSARVWDLSNDGALDLVGHEDDVYGVAFAPDGKQLATGDVRAVIRVWDLADGSSREYRGHTAGIENLVFFGDGHRLASTSEDGTARIWDLASAASTVLRHGPRVLGVAVSRDGSTLVTSADDGAVRIWDVSTARLRATVQAHHAASDRVVLSPDEHLIATTGRDGLVNLIDAASGTIVHRLVGHEREVTGVAFARGGRSLLSVGVDATLREWDVATGQVRQVLRGHTSRIRRVAVAPDGHHVVTGGDDHLVRIWDLDDASSIVLRGHTDSVTGVDYSSDGKYVTSVARDATMRIWDTARGTLLDLARADSAIFRVVFSPDAQRIAHVGWDRRVHVVPVDPRRFVPQTAAGLRAWLDHLTTARVDSGGRVETN